MNLDEPMKIPTDTGDHPGDMPIDDQAPHYSEVEIVTPEGS